MQRNLVILVALISLSGCVSKTPIELSQEGATMQEIFSQHVSGGAGPKYPLLSDLQSRSFDNDLNNNSMFKAQPYQRMDNPELVLYVYPRRVSDQGVIMPGYSVRFPMYKSVQYMLPSERAIQ